LTILIFTVKFDYSVLKETMSFNVRQRGEQRKNTEQKTYRTETDSVGFWTILWQLQLNHKLLSSCFTQ